jgi:hypothetical protein
MVSDSRSPSLFQRLLCSVKHKWERSNPETRLCLRCGRSQKRCPDCNGTGGTFLETKEYCASPDGCGCGWQSGCAWIRTDHEYHPRCNTCNNRHWITA